MVDTTPVPAYYALLTVDPVVPASEPIMTQMDRRNFDSLGNDLNLPIEIFHSSWLADHSQEWGFRYGVSIWEYWLIGFTVVALSFMAYVTIVLIKEYFTDRPASENMLL